MADNTLEQKTVLLIISGGIAAYKALEFIRLLKKENINVRAILTRGGGNFITPLSVSALSGEHTYTDLWSLKDETEMGHIMLSREADLIVIAPASANMIAKMAHGLADDLASTALLASDKPVMIAPAMNHKMWNHPATRTNISTLKERGVQIIGPEEGDMACNEYGPGRMSEPETILHAVKTFLSQKNTEPAYSGKPLKGRKALVTSGPTYEALDPVRFIGNRSSGRQGHAIAAALHKAGADVTLVSGPVSSLIHQTLPAGINVLKTESAQEMLEACLSLLPADIAVCAAAVSDWRSAFINNQKIKKNKKAEPPLITLTENPDILHILATHEERPNLVIGFAAETENTLENARAKRLRKSCDWIIANEVGPDKGFDQDKNHVYLIKVDHEEEWPTAGKNEIAEKLAREITNFFKGLGTVEHAAE